MRKATVGIVLAAGLIAAYLAWRTPSERAKPSTSSSEVVTLTDSAGREIAISKPIKRIVLMRSLCMYELAAVLGDEVEDKLVGWDSSLKTGDRDAYEKFIARYPRLKEIAVLGDVLRDTVSAEAVLALDPDLVIVNTYMRQTKSKGLERLERAGVPLLYVDLSDPFHDPQKCLSLLGQVFGKEDRAEEMVNWINTQQEQVFRRLERIEGPAPAIYLEAGTHGAEKYGNTFGVDTARRPVNWGSALTQLRCRNIAADTVSGAYGMGPIRPEHLIKADPDVIVITGADWTAYPGSLRLGYHAKAADATRLLGEFTRRPGWEHLQAVQSGRVYGIHTRFGSHVMSFAAAQQLAKWLYPEEFHDLDPEASLREFHEKFMPIDYSGAWMVALTND